MPETTPPVNTEVQTSSAETQTAPSTETQITDRPEQNRIAELERKLEAASKAIAEREQADKAAAEKKALENQEFEKVIAAKEADLTEIKKKLEEQQQQSEKISIENMLIQEGITDVYARRGVALEYLSLESDKRAAFLETLKKENPALFNKVQGGFVQGSAGSVSQGAGGGGEDWAAIKKQSEPMGNSPATVRSAWQKVREYANKNGKNPPGFE